MVSVSASTTNGVYANQINRNEKFANKALGQVATGKAINKASDNAAGLAVSMKLSADVSTLRAASSNLLQGTSVLQTADGALEQSGNILNRMRELSTQASSGSLDTGSRTSLNDEYQSLKTELDGISANTIFSGQKLVDGSYNNQFQAGTDVTNTINVNLSAVDSSAAGVGLTAGVGASATALTTPTSAQAAGAELDAAISKVSSYRAEVGAFQSAFSTRGEVVDDQIENTISAESAIMDADIGKAMSDFRNSKNMSELSLAAAAQGNKMSTSMLKLVR